MPLPLAIPQEGPEALASLVIAAQSGSNEAFGELVRRFQGSMSLFIRSQIRGYESHEQDVCQETFLLAFRKIDQLKEPRAFGSWLRTIARCTSINFLTRGKLSRTVSLNAPLVESGEEWMDAVMDPLSHTPVEILIGREEEKAVEEAVGSLNDAHRRTAELFYNDGRSLKETVAQLSVEEGRDVPEGTVKRRLHTARQRMKNACSFLMEDPD